MEIAMSTAAYHKEWKRLHPDKVREYARRGYLKHKEAKKLYAQKNAAHIARLKYLAAQKPERKARQNQKTLARYYAKKHEPEFRAKRKAILNARRSRFGASLDVAVLAQMEAIRQRGTHCPHCGYFTAAPAAHIDHLTPLARGGTSTAGNMVVSCGPCNRSKHTKMPIEFIWERAAQ
jgi:5-methylcytosine-specific restriction endonuclease McrA